MVNRKSGASRVTPMPAWIDNSVRVDNRVETPTSSKPTVASDPAILAPLSRECPERLRSMPSRKEVSGLAARTAPKRRPVTSPGSRVCAPSVLLNVQVPDRVPKNTRGSSRLTAVSAPCHAGQLLVADQDETRDTLESRIALRVGLPWSTQAEIRVPYSIDRRTTTTIGATELKEHASGLGDIEASLTKQLVSERARIPGLLGTVGFKSASGSSGSLGSLAPGLGYRSVSLRAGALFLAGPNLLSKFDALNSTEVLGCSDTFSSPGDRAPHAAHSTSCETPRGVPRRR